MFQDKRLRQVCQYIKDAGADIPDCFLEEPTPIFANGWMEKWFLANLKHLEESLYGAEV